MIGCSCFGDDIGSVETAASNYIQEIMLLGGCLMWNDAAVCGGRIWLKKIVSVWSDLWKSRERESSMMFYVPLLCFEYRYILLLTSVHPSQRATASCDYAFAILKDALCIQPSAL